MESFKIKNVGIIPNLLKDPNLKETSNIISILKQYGLVSYLSKEFESIPIPEAIYKDDWSTSVDAILCIGGDGTFLKAAQFAITSKKPLLGYNLGRLGYLAEISRDCISCLNDLSLGKFEIKERSLLEWTLYRDGQATPSKMLALNDVSVLHLDTLGIADLTLEDDSGNTIHYLADGVVVSTPSGSTAYNFSCGGPIIDSRLSVLCCTPVCPHSLLNRSLVLSGEEPIKIKNTSTRNEVLSVCIDGKSCESLHPSDYIEVVLSSTKLQVITFSSHQLFSTLKKKLIEAEL